MRNGVIVFFAAFIALGVSWYGFVLAPVKQLGTAKQAAVLNSSDIYPRPRPGDATLGLQVYRANGCAACHTEQVRQDGVACDVVLPGSETNHLAVLGAVANEMQAHHWHVNNYLGPPGMPYTILSGVSKADADIASGRISAAHFKVETHIFPVGRDIARGWGLRRSVAGDFLYDYPVQPGSLRAGPDLANVGARLPDANWQLVHLYAPQALVKNSAMPPFRFLFEIRKIGGAPSPDALQFPKDFALPAGCEVVPKPEAKQLAAYLLSLCADTPLYEAPFTSVVTKP
jgi:cbb3-type cytochrome oxidase cytochrome c subunit